MPVLEDVERDEFLKKEGWEILRFPNHRVLYELPNIIEEILKILNINATKTRSRNNV